MKKLLPIPPEKLIEFMPYIEKYVRPAFETGIGEKTYEQIMGLAFLGEVICWLAVTDDKIVGVATTEIMEFPAYRTVHIITAGTDNHAGFEDFHPFLQDYAISIGARNLQFWGRKGWSKAVLKIPGRNGEKYKEVYRVFAMEINYDINAPDEPDLQTP